MATVKEKKRKADWTRFVTRILTDSFASGAIRPINGSLRRKRSKGKGKGILGARETRGALPHRLLINRLGVVPDGLP